MKLTLMNVLIISGIVLVALRFRRELVELPVVRQIEG